MDNSLRYLMEHKAFNKPSNPIGNALQSYINYVKPRLANPLQTLANEAQRFTRMNPQELTGEVANSLNGGIAGTFIGKNAKTWNNVMAETAQQLEAKGIPPAQIWKETGTFKGADGKWRQEIDDSQATVYDASPELAKEYVKAFESGDKKAARVARDEMSNYLPPYQRQQTLDMDQVMGHGKLVDAYPYMMSGTRYQYSPNTLGMGSASYDPTFNKIRMGAINTEGARKNLIHELQHNVQREEGFLAGGSPSTMPLELEYIASKKRDAANSLFDLGRRNDPLDAGSVVKPGAIKKASKLQREAIDLDTQIRRMNDNPSLKQDAYEKLYGEAEGRMSEYRMDLSPEQRLAQYPLDPAYFEQATGVPLNSLIIRP